MSALNTGGDVSRRVMEALSDSFLSEEEKRRVAAAAITRRPILIHGPPGVGKELVAQKLAEALFGSYVTVNCSSNLSRQDLFGDVDPIALKKYGLSDERSYVLGILEKADGSALLLRGIQNMPEKVAEDLASFLEEGVISVGQRERHVSVGIIATATDLSINERLLDRFHVVQVSYPDSEKERQIISQMARAGVEVPDDLVDVASRFLQLSRNHPDLEAGASTRSGIRFVENVSACMELSGRDPDEEDLANSSSASFAHTIKVNPLSWKSNAQITREILSRAVASVRKGRRAGHSGRLPSLSRYKVPIIAGLLLLLVISSGYVAMRERAKTVKLPENRTGSLPVPPPMVQPEAPNLTRKLTEVEKVPPQVLEEVAKAIGGLSANATKLYDPLTDTLYVSSGNKSVAVPNYTSVVLSPPQGGRNATLPSAGGGGGARVNIPLLLLAVIAGTFLSTFLFDRLGPAGIRESYLMRRLRRRFQITWEPLTRLYKNIPYEDSSLAGELEGRRLGDAVKEISSARDELYAERARPATFSEIAALAREKRDRYPTLSRLLGADSKEGAFGWEQKRAAKELMKVLEREGLIRRGKEISFTHRASKVLLSDLDSTILGRIYDALQGVAYEELPPLPSSDVRDVRRYVRGDSYRDVAIRETIRDAIRRGRRTIERDNLFVYEREPERRQVVVQGNADVVVVTDLSGSMAYADKLWYAKQAIVVTTIIAEAYGNRVGVVGFRDLSTEVAELGVEREETISKVMNLLPRGGTNIAAGIRRAIDLLVGGVKEVEDSKEAERLHLERKKQIILLTDGDATHPKPKQFAADYARRMARLASRLGITISVICIGTELKEKGIGSSYNPELAADLARIGGGRLIFVREMKDLSRVFVSEIDRIMIGSGQPAAYRPLKAVGSGTL